MSATLFLKTLFPGYGDPLTRWYSLPPMAGTDVPWVTDTRLMIRSDLLNGGIPANTAPHTHGFAGMFNGVRLTAGEPPATFRVTPPFERIEVELHAVPVAYAEDGSALRPGSTVVVHDDLSYVMVNAHVWDRLEKMGLTVEARVATTRVVLVWFDADGRPAAAMGAWTGADGDLGVRAAAVLTTVLTVPA